MAQIPYRLCWVHQSREDELYFRYEEGKHSELDELGATDAKGYELQRTGEHWEQIVRAVNLHDELVAALRDYESEQSELAFHSGLKPDSRFTALLAKAK